MYLDVFAQGVKSSKPILGISRRSSRLTCSSDVASNSSGFSYPKIVSQISRFLWLESSVFFEFSKGGQSTSVLPSKRFIFMYLTCLDTRWALGNILGNTQLPFVRHILYTSSIDLTSDSQFWLVTICACWPLNLHTILSYVSKLNLLVYIPIICICVWVWVGMGMMCMDMDMYVCWLFALIFSFFCVEIPGDS